MKSHTVNSVFDRKKAAVGDVVGDVVGDELGDAEGDAVDQVVEANNANTECHTYHGRNNYMQRKKQLGIKYCTVSQF